MNLEVAEVRGAVAITPLASGAGASLGEADAAAVVVVVGGSVIVVVSSTTSLATSITGLSSDSAGEAEGEDAAGEDTGRVN